MKNYLSLILLLFFICIALVYSCNNSGNIINSQLSSSGEIYFTKFKDTTIGFETYSISSDGSNRNLVTELGIITSIPYHDKMTIGKIDSLFFLSKLYVMNTNGTNAVEIPRNNYFPVYFILSPDASKVLFTTDAGNYLCIVNSDGSNLLQISSHISGNETTPKFSPDSKRIAFLESVPNVQRYLSIINTDGTNLLRIKDSIIIMHHSSLSWSPDGSEIAFSNYSLSKSSIYVINTDGTGYFNLSKSNHVDIDPEWSPDGTKVVFVSYEPSGLTDISFISSDGSGKKNLTNTSNVHEVFPHWSPDGTKIIYASHYGGKSALTITDINTGNSICLADTTASSFAFWNFSD